jgi:hypothetical protein
MLVTSLLFLLKHKAKKVIKVHQRDRELGCKILMQDLSLLPPRSLEIIMDPIGNLPYRLPLYQGIRILVKGNYLSWNFPVIWMTI